MLSSILKIVIAASTANFKLLTFDIVGSKTPCAKLFLTFPKTRSSPEYFNAIFFSSSHPTFYEALWYTLSLAKSSVASFAALIASVFGIIYKASENSATASCSLEPRVLAKSSRYTDRATSTAPPPATTLFDSRTLFTIEIESCTDLSISSKKYEFAPLKIMVYDLV
jgi:hypothetical protein